MTLFDVQPGTVYPLSATNLAKIEKKSPQVVFLSID